MKTRPNYYQEFAHTKMIWGKYKGYYLKDLPEDYLKWAIMNYTDLGMAEMMSIELQRRNKSFR